MLENEVWTNTCDGTIFSTSSCPTVLWMVHQLSRGGSPLSDPTVGGLFNPTSPFIFWLCLLCAACLSHHKSPTGQPVFTLPMRHGLSPQQPATTPLPHPPTPREQLFLYFRHNLQTVRQHTAAKVRCHIVVWAHFKMSEQTGAIIRFHQGLLSSGSAFIYFWQVYCSL